MHYLFEVKLLVNAILDEAPEADREGFRRDVRRQHVTRYLMGYYREHGRLPEGRQYLGMTRPLNLEVGMINFDQVRQRIRVAGDLVQATQRGEAAMAVAGAGSSGEESETGQHRNPE